MAGIEVFTPPNEPQMDAVAYLTPKIQESRLDFKNREPYIVDGYDVHTVDGAEGYLRDIHGLGERIDKIREQFDPETGIHLAFAMQREPRAALLENGEHQDVATHSFNVALTAPWIALAKNRTDVDPYLASFKGTYHDVIMETYGGDTPTQDPIKMLTKGPREAASFTLFLHDVGDSPIAEIMWSYELGLTPTDRFAKGIDKVDPVWVALANNTLVQLVGKNDYHQYVWSTLLKAAIDPTALELMCKALVKVGERWPEACIPFDGSPAEIVAMYRDAIKDQGADIHVLPTVEQPETVEEYFEDGELIPFPVQDKSLRVHSGKLAIFGNAASVTELDKWLEEHKPPPPPPEFPTPAGMAMAAC